MTTRGWTTLVGCLMTVLLASGCEFTGINSQPLPFAEGGGSNDLRITVVLENATNLVPNSEVRYNEVEVGSVRKIEFDQWTAKLTLGVDEDARIPADVTAKVAQKSLLGAEYLELSSPARTTPAPDASVRALLVDGAHLGLDRTGRYPETEEVLSAAALLLNGGGLPQIRTIAHELNATLDGRQSDTVSMIRRISTFTGTLARQQDQIIGVLEELDAFAQVLDEEGDGIATALDDLPKGVQALQRERSRLVRALESVDDVAGIAHRVVEKTEDGVVTNLANLRPLTKQLSDAATTLAQTVDEVSWPFPIKAIDKSFHGDYINLFATVDLNLADTARHWTAGTPLEQITATLLGIPVTASGATDPLRPRPPEGRNGDAHVGTPEGDGGTGPDESGRGPADPGLALDALLGALLGGRS